MQFLMNFTSGVFSSKTPVSIYITRYLSHQAMETILCCTARNVSSFLQRSEDRPSGE